MDEKAQIFAALKAMMQAYQPPFTVKVDEPTRYELWSNKAVEIDGRKRKEVFFAALIIQKAYVGFYYMPVYAETELKKIFKPELLKLLKGKSCFHVKKLDAALEGQIREALEIGRKLYQDRGWV
jgi:hypothetical protein